MSSRNSSPTKVLVELTGPSGVGKSTLKKHLASSRSDVMTDRELVRRLVRSRWALVFLRRAVVVLIRVFWGVRSSRLPRNKGKGYEWRRMARWALLAAALMSRRHLPDREHVILVDEIGPSALAWNFAAFGDGGFSLLEQAWFLHICPPPDLLVQVTCGRALRDERRQERTGGVRRETALGPSAARDRQDQAIRQSVAEWFEARGSMSRIVCTDGDLDGSLQQLSAFVDQAIRR